MISGGANVMDLIHIGKGSDEFIDKLSSSVSGHEGGDTMVANHIFIQELHNRLGICFLQSSGFNPFGEVVDGNNNVALVAGGAGQGSHDIYSNLIEGFGEFLDGFKGSFSFSSLALLAGLAGLDISNDILFHPRPVEVLRNLQVGVVLAKMACEGSIM